MLKNLKVDFTFLHTVSNKNMKKRLYKRKNLNRYDSFKKEFYKKVQRGFLNLAKKNSKKYLVINSNSDIKSNEFKIIEKMIQLLK